MKLKIILPLILLLASAFADEAPQEKTIVKEDISGYYAIGFGFLSVPDFEVGSRIPIGHIHINPYLGGGLVLPNIKAGMRLLLFTQPYDINQLYIGIGAGFKYTYLDLGYFGDRHFLLLSPDYILGYQWTSPKSKKYSFVQASVSWPNYDFIEEEVIEIPQVIFSYGRRF
jgi:hypothetical protein